MKRVVAIYENKMKMRGNCRSHEVLDALTEHGFSIENVSVGQEMHAGHPSLPALKLVANFKDQIKIFIRLFKIVKAGDIVYINSTRAIAAALVARMKKAKLICHLDSDAKPITVFDQFAKRMIAPLIDHAIFNSVSLKKNFSLKVKQQTVIYNSLPDKFDIIPIAAKVGSSNEFCVVIPIHFYNIQKQTQIFTLASLLPQVKFRLLNSCDADLSSLFSALRPPNIEIIKESYMEHPYRSANLFLDLSDSSENTFSGDLEMLEAMRCGLPVIVSADGALQELMINGKHGLKVPTDNVQVIAEAIERLNHHKLLYEKLSSSCRNHAKLFSKQCFESEFIKPFLGQRLNPYHKLAQLFGDAYLNLETSVFAKPEIN